jgi:hypothetical protein
MNEDSLIMNPGNIPKFDGEKSKISMIVAQI